MLYVASYGDATSANDDFKALKSAREDGLVVVGAVVMTRADTGDVKVKEVGEGDVSGGATIGAIGGLVVGLFAPPLLLATGIGAGLGAGIGALIRHHEEKAIGVDADEYLPPGSSAIVAVVDDSYLDGVDKALGKADKKITKAIDSGDYDKVKKAVQKSAGEITDSIES
jgi:uncharacterized membrane protein